MLETDRDLYMAFCQELGTDFEWTRRLIDGEISAGPDLAQALALKTDAAASFWQDPPRPVERLIAVKLWGIKRSRRQGQTASGPRSTDYSGQRPAVDVDAPWPSPYHRRCPGCD